MLSSLQVLAQLQEDFDDNDLTTNPSWSGFTDNFTTAAGMLQLNAEAVSSSSFVSTASSTVFGSWEITVNLKFNPSGSNFTRIYLVSDKPDLNASLNGYFIQVGSSADDICLFRQSGDSKVKIIDGKDGLLNSDEVVVKVVASRDNSGLWTLTSDLGITGTALLEGTSNDVTHSFSAFCGIQCTYTSTRSKSFLFDNFKIASPEDTTPPEILKLIIISSTEIELEFSEPLDISSASEISNYIVAPVFGSIVNVGVLNNSSTIRLSFQNPFPADESCTLRIEKLKDVASNEILPTQLSFVYSPPVIAAYKDVVISEIMADFAPEQVLPSAEFIEIFNRSGKTFDLGGWTLSDGKTPGILSSQFLLPGEFAILAAASTAESFASYGKVISVSGFPSLNNSGDALCLRSKDGILIDSLYYSDAWYRDDEKKSGGWSIEIIDPDNICGEENNWSASEDNSGGTPGKINSIDAENLDLTGPEIISAVLISPDTIQLNFNERLSTEVPSPADFVFEGTRSVTMVLPDKSLKEIELLTTPVFEKGQSDFITVENIYDCAGNKLKQSEPLLIVFPEQADSLDIVLNEVLFNPRSTGADYVEIKNVSGKYIDLKDWSFANMIDGTATHVSPVATTSQLLKPGEIIAFTSDPQSILNEFPDSSENKIFNCDMPPMSDDAGTIALIDPRRKVVDVFFYSEDMHSIFLQETEGVSLERISSTLPTNDRSNWSSASGQFNYGTPGIENSNSFPARSDLSPISIDPEIFIPESGQPNFALVNYSFDRPGFIGNVRIFDSRGRLIKTLAENALLPVSGFLRWDGDREDGSRALVGSYMVWFEVYNSDGAVNIHRKRVAIAGHF